VLAPASVPEETAAAVCEPSTLSWVLVLSSVVMLGDGIVALEIIAGADIGLTARGDGVGRGDYRGVAAGLGRILHVGFVRDTDIGARVRAADGIAGLGGLDAGGDVGRNELGGRIVDGGRSGAGRGGGGAGDGVSAANAIARGRVGARIKFR